MMHGRAIIASALLSVFIIATAVRLVSKAPETVSLRRKLLAEPNEEVQVVTYESITTGEIPALSGGSANTDEIKDYKLPAAALKWCQLSGQNPLHYRSCDENGTFNRIPFGAGLTNGLKMLLLMVIESYERNQCFFVTEANNPMLIREDKTQELSTFIGRYFEPIGLPEDDRWVQKALKENRVQDMTWQEVWNDMEKRRTHGNLHNITALHYHNIESTILKKVMLERLWRLLPPVRDDACRSLESHGLEEEYMAFSVRRGDKDTEGFEFMKPEKYIEAAESVVDEHFDGVMPKIFVAADDCKIMEEFRALRPEWIFESECDQSTGHNGFVLGEMKEWTLKQTDEHYRKFWVELIGLAGSKFYIGVAHTNVAWWAAYMRPHRWSHIFLDTHTENALNNW
eukprot:CAMPEP_0194202882 /NCGR_PEP_ID=MMETSP0156-20130528/2799_1 /TAXON_ID=33649 /ORGANISM="Thalassionema nitzschioides, Strain L26-B" /LENGTH=397 /DNA_ID=CAMNT_0038928499 /DNA_START=68 /DNA_END=1261 /DNA_ORIENTATION=+